MKGSEIYKRVLWVLAALIASIILVASVSKLGPARGVEKGASIETFTAQMDARIPALMEDYGIPGASIALVKDGGIVWTGAYGYADLEEGREMTAGTYCRVQSISKPVTAWGVLKLVAQDKIELDASVGQYIKSWPFPESKYSTDKITVRQLLSHYSGMPLGDVLTIYSPEEELPSLKESLTESAHPMQEPGVSFSYSNVGFNLLELLIEEVTGRDFSEYMEKEVLIPLGMNRSTFTWSEALAPPVPLGYGLTGKTVPVYVYPEKASGGLFASAEDVAAFVIAGMPDFAKEHPVLSPQDINQLYMPEAQDLGVYSLVFDSYGLGYYIENLPDGKKAVSHGGQGTGIMTHFHAVPETGDGIVILTNSQRSWPFISYIVSDWARWCGFSTVGMGRIILGQYLLWAFIGLVWFVLLLQIWRLAEGIISGRRKPALFSKKLRLLRLAQLSLFLILAISLLWCVNQDYLFLTSVFPVASGWLGISACALAFVLLISALFPKDERKIKSFRRRSGVDYI